MNTTPPINTRKNFKTDNEVLAAAKAMGLGVIKHGRWWHLYGRGIDIRTCQLRSIHPDELNPGKPADPTRKSRYV